MTAAVAPLPPQSPRPDQTPSAGWRRPRPDPADDAAPVTPTAPGDYERDAATIYVSSFAIIRSEADLSDLPPDLEPVVVRIVHAAGDVSLAGDVEASPELVRAARGALRSGAGVWCDSLMLAHGVTRRRLPAANPVHCTLADPRTVDLAARLGTTRSAAAVDIAVTEGLLDGAVAAIGNAPTALFRLLELVLAGRVRPAAIIGVPVGFVGAAESKQALATSGHDVPWLTVHGRRGGTPIAAAAVNALASEHEGMV